MLPAVVLLLAPGLRAFQRSTRCKNRLQNFVAYATKFCKDGSGAKMTMGFQLVALFA